MTIFRCFLVSDVHIGNHLPHAVANDAGVTDRLADQLSSLEWAFAQADERDLPLVCTGDLFDDHGVDTITLEYFGTSLGLHAPRRGFFVIPGNHDAHDQTYQYFSPSAIGRLTDGLVTVLDDLHDPKPKSVIEGGELIAALPFCGNSAAREFFAAHADKRKLLLAHLEVRTFGHGGAWTCSDGLAEEELAPWGAVITGHFHMRQRFKATQGGYAGALTQQKFDDAGKAQGGWVISWDGEQLTEEFVPWTEAPTFRTEKISAAKLAEDAVQADLAGAPLFSGCTFLKLAVEGTDEELEAVGFDRLRRQIMHDGGVRRVIFDHRPIASVEKRKLDVDVGAPLEDLLAAYVEHPSVSTGSMDRERLLGMGVRLLRAAGEMVRLDPVAAADEGPR